MQLALDQHLVVPEEASFFVNMGQYKNLINYSHRTRRPWIKNEKSKDYCKADLKQRVLFFITILVLRLAIPAFFRFTDVTELM